MRKRRRFTEEFKQHAVDLANQAGVIKRQMAEELGIDAKMFGRCCQEQSTHGPKAFPALGKARDDEIAALKRELARVKRERDFLKEAATFFARESK